MSNLESKLLDGMRPATGEGKGKAVSERERERESGKQRRKEKKKKTGAMHPTAVKAAD